MDTSCVQKLSLGFIPLLTFSCVMLSTIKLDTEPVVMTVKIQDIGPDGLLASKFESQQLTATASAPEKFFYVGLIFAQPSREIEKFRVQRDFHAALTLALSRREGNVTQRKGGSMGPFSSSLTPSSPSLRTRRSYVRRRDSVC